MAKNNKFLMIAIALVLMQVSSIAQSTNWGWDWKDSSKVATKNKPQYSEFLNNSFPYPARPKDQWEIGLGLGAALVSGDVTPNLGFGATLTARKSLSHVFSLREYFSFYSASGGGVNFAPDYKAKYTALGTDLLISLNTIRSYSGNPKSNFYFLVGVGFLSTHLTQSIAGKDVQFYSPATSNVVTSFGFKKGGVGNGSTVTVMGLNLGGGYAYKINDNFNLGLEIKSTLTNYDYLDGVSTQFSNAFDALFFPHLKLNWNVGNKASRVQPLWWINPNNYVYNELNAPQHMKMKKPVLDDADKDGITDQFDLEPNTPAGASVDAHGRAIDTDGDGIPDFKDKERLTAQKCFPVNNEGVGSCPADACCTESREKISELQKIIEANKLTKEGGAVISGQGGADCSITNLPSINFKSGGSKLNRESMSLLDAVALQMRNNPGCKIKVLGHPESNKSSQQKAYDRVEAIIKYLVEKQGIAESRFIFAYEGGNGDSNTVDLMGTTEEGPNTVPAPHPQLKGKQNY